MRIKNILMIMVGLLIMPFFVSTSEAVERPIVLAFQNSHFAAPIHVAVEKGFFKQEGVNVEVRSFAPGTGPVINEGIASGDIDIGEMGLTPALVAITRIPVVIFATTGSCEQPVIVSLNSGIKDVPGLKGKKIAVAKRGTWQDFLTRDLLSRYNMNPDKDVDMTIIPGPETLTTMKKGLIDAATVTTMYALKGENMGISKVLIWPTKKFWPKTAGIVYIVRKELVRNRKHDLKKITQALVNGLKLKWYCSPITPPFLKLIFLGYYHLQKCLNPCL